MAVDTSPSPAPCKAAAKKAEEERGDSRPYHPDSSARNLDAPFPTLSKLGKSRTEEDLPGEQVGYESSVGLCSLWGGGRYMQIVKHSGPDMIYDCNPRSQDTGARQLPGARAYPVLHTEFQAIPDYRVQPHFK